MPKSFGALSALPVDGQTYHYYRLGALAEHGLDVTLLPFSLKVLLENLLRNEDGHTVTADDIRALAEMNIHAALGMAIYTGRLNLEDLVG